MSEAEVFKYLKSLPAILGVASFFAYLWVGQAKIGGDILKAIIEKLRANPNLDIEKYGQLTPAKIDKLIQTDEKIKSSVNVEDARLLGRLVVLQYLMTSLVLVVCALLVAVSIWLYTREDALSLSVKEPRDDNPKAGGLLVDLDDIVVEWTCSGKPQQVSVCLENLDSHAHCTKKVVDSNTSALKHRSSERP